MDLHKTFTTNTGDTEREAAETPVDLFGITDYIDIQYISIIELVQFTDQIHLVARVGTAENKRS